MTDSIDMPTIDELRKFVRAALQRPVVESISDLVFARRELHALGADHVYDEEERRYELLKRGFTPPEDLRVPNSPPKNP